MDTGSYSIGHGSTTGSLSATGKLAVKKTINPFPFCFLAYTFFA
jgi:hypothetical protein